MENNHQPHPVINNLINLFQDKLDQIRNENENHFENNHKLLMANSFPYDQDIIAEENIQNIEGIFIYLPLPIFTHNLINPDILIITMNPDGSTDPNGDWYNANKAASTDPNGDWYNQ